MKDTKDSLTRDLENDINEAIIFLGEVKEKKKAHLRYVNLLKAMRRATRAMYFFGRLQQIELDETQATLGE